jgi:flagellar motor switch protein FliG
VAELLAALAVADVDGWTQQAAGESPQVIAALLKALPAERVSGVLAGLSTEVQKEVLALLAGLDSAVPAGAAVLQPVRRRNAVSHVDRNVAEATPRHVGWFQRRRRVNSDVHATDWGAAEGMTPEEASHLDQITDLDPGTLRLRYGELPVDVWSTALMGASSAFRVRLLSALAAADAAALRQALTRQRPARLSEIESAQSEVLSLLNGRTPVGAESQ